MNSAMISNIRYGFRPAIVGTNFPNSTEAWSKALISNAALEQFLLSTPSANRSKIQEKSKQRHIAPPVSPFQR